MFVPKKYALITFYLGLFLLLAAVLGSAQTTYTCSPCAVSVTGDDSVGGEHDGSPYPSTLTVAGAGTVSAITVELDGLAAHGFNDSTGIGTEALGVLLKSPDGRYLEILADPSNGSQSLSNVTLTISDSAATALPDQNSTWPATSGTLGPYHPSSYTNSGTQTYSSPGPGVLTSSHRAAPLGTGTLANIFTGAQVNGTWSLFLIDNTGGSGDLISITGWKITITAAAASPTTTSLSSNLNPSFTSGSNSSVTLTATVSPNPGGGTVAFVDGVTTIAGCTAQALNGSGQATCNTTFSTEGNHQLTAVFGGTASFATSTSPILNQFVKNHSTLSSGQYCNPGTLSVPGNTNPVPDPSIINVGTDTTPIGNAVSTIAVAINSLSADQAGAIRFLLVAPSGQAMEFWGWAGDFTPTSGSFFIFDSASSPLPASGTLVAGSYQPTVNVQGDTFLSGPAPAPPAPASFSVAAPAGNPTPASFLSTFNGATANGDWKLFAYYNGGSGHTLTVGNWCLDITPASGAATVTTVNSTENPSRTGDSITIAALVTSGGNPVTSGTVTFTENGVAVAGTAGTPVAVNGSGMASVVTNALPEGDHTIKATYNPSSSSFNLSFSTYVQRVDNNSVISVSGGFYSYCNQGQITIPGPNNASNIGPASPNPSNIFVTNAPGTISRVSIEFFNYHVPADDISTLLVGPGATNGQTLDLFSGIANNVPFGPVTITLDDAGNSLSNSSAPVTGIYTPTSYTSNDTFFASLSGLIPFPTVPYQYAAPSGPTTLSLFNNQDPNGIWSLYFNQTTHASGGTMGSWCIRFALVHPVLTISKSHLGDFNIGQTDAQYTITVHNDGPGKTGSDGGPVVVTDTLPVGMTATAASGTGWSCTTGTTPSCSRSDALAAGSSYPIITLTVTVGASTATPTVTNQASVSGGGAGTATTTDDTTILAPADLTISKSHTGNFTQGQTGATFTITVTNQGLGATNSAVNVQDTLPSGLTATAMSGSGWTCNFNTQFCSTSNLLAANTPYPDITLTVDVASNAPASVINSVAVSGGGEVNTTNDTATDSVTVNGGPDLTITKTHSGNFSQGQTGATYTITVTNSGGTATSGTVTVTDTLPSGLTATSIAGTSWSCTQPSGPCTRSDSLAPSTPYPALTLTVNVANNATSPQVNSATVSGGGEVNTTNDTATDSVTVNAGPDLTITKTHSGNFSQGQTGATYTITVTNSGGTATSGTVTVTDTLPSGLTATSIAGTSWSCTQPSGPCTRSDSLPPSTSYPALTLTVNVANNAPSSVTNVASVSGGNEVNSTNDTATDSTTISGGPDLAISKTHSGNFTQGQTGATYTITVSNVGTASTNGTVTVADTLPAGLTATQLSGSGWTCSVSTLQCTRSTVLNSGTSYPPITLKVNVASNAPASVTNMASVSGGGDTNSSNNTATDPTTVLTGPDLTISKTHSGDFTKGQTGATYTITVGNIGGAPSSGTVKVVDTLPSGLTATAISGSGWSCTLSSLTCTRSDSLPGSSLYPPITLTVKVASNAPSSVTNKATVSCGSDTNPNDNTATDPTNIISPPADLTVTKSHSGNFTQGQTGATYSIRVNNIGSSSTTGTVTVVDALPSGLTATAMSGSGWSCTLSTLTCTRSTSLPGNSSYPAITLTVNVDSNAPSSVTNSATVSGGGETNTGNDTASDPTTLNPSSGGVIMVTPGNLDFGYVNLGDTKSLPLTVKNASSSNMQITNITFNYGPGAGKDFGYTTQCGGTIKPGRTCTITVKLHAQDLGSGAAILNIYYNGVGSPVQVGLTGTVINPKAKLNKSSLNFGNVKVGHNSTSSVTLTSSGDTALMLNSITISGSSDFMESDNCPLGGSLSPNAYCTINLTFAPSAKRSRSATLNISDNASSSPQTVSLSGDGD